MMCAIIVLLLLLLCHLRLSLFLESVDTVTEHCTAYPKFHNQRLVSNYLSRHIGCVRERDCRLTIIYYIKLFALSQAAIEAGIQFGFVDCGNPLNNAECLVS